MLSSLRIVPLMLLVAGCQEAPNAASTASATAASGKPAGSGAAAGSAGPEKAASLPQKNLTVTLDGKPVEIVTALASQEEGKLKIDLSSAPFTCADFAGNGRTMVDGEVTFTAWFKPGLQKDGTLTQNLASTWFLGMTAPINKPTKVEGDGSEGKPTAAELDFETESAGKNKKKLVVKGKVDAVGCSSPKTQLPELPPATDLSIEVAGKKVPVRSASIEEETDRKRLTLYTGGEDCKGSGRSGDVTLIVSIEDGKPWQLSLMGELIPQQVVDQTFDKKKVKVKLPAKAPGDAELAIDAAVMGYPIKVNGKVAAQACAK